MSDRPEYVKCILRGHVDHLNETWCGKPKEGFSFVNIEHAAENGKQEGRLVACRECVAAIVKALNNGSEE